MSILADMSSFLGSVWFALLLGVAGFVAGYWVKAKNKF